MRDSEIEQWVLRELGRQRNGNSKEICIYAVDGIVTLTGSVRTRYERSIVQKAALRAEAVVAVINQVKVLRTEPSIPAIPVPHTSRLHVKQYQVPAPASVAGTQRV